MRNWKQRLFSLLLCGALVASLCPAALAENVSIPYLDETGTEKSCEKYRDAATSLIWDGGWYVAQDRGLAPSRIIVTGEVHLILANGCDLAATQGIEVSEGNSLTIYAQSKDESAGKLMATGNSSDAGIGGGQNDDGGTITINGGTVEASSTSGAGIGGGRDGDGGTITINGGTVKATSEDYGAGIGGGQNGDGGTITISGGTVTATSEDYGAGIGGGRDGAGGKITINNGTVKATSNGYGAGIGGGRDGDGGKITIDDGMVTATGAGGAGIGGGNGGDGGIIAINGGTVTAASRDGGNFYGGAGIGGGGDGGGGGSITISGGTVEASSTSSADIGGGYDHKTGGIAPSDKIEIGEGANVKGSGGGKPNLGPPHGAKTDKWASDSTGHWHPCEVGSCAEQFDKTVHSFGDWIIDTPATTTPGSRHRDCGDCQYQETETIPPIEPPDPVDPPDPEPPKPVDPPSGGDSYTPPTYRPDVTQPDAGGTVSVTPSHPERGDTVTVKPKPDEGYELDSITVTDRDGKPIEVVVRPDGTYTFQQPAGKVKIEVTYKPIETPWNNPFADVSKSDWYYEAVRFVQEQGLMNGYSDGRFGANDTLSRAQLAQILFSKEGRPGAGSLPDFSDVAGEAWYADAVRWAASQGIVGGYGNGTFGPDAPITREQLAVMLWRYSGSPAATNEELYFNDESQISGYALEALRWAVENGVLNGYGDGRLGPQGQATRAQVAQMLKNFIENQEADT